MIHNYFLGSLLVVLTNSALSAPPLFKCEFATALKNPLEYTIATKINKVIIWGYKLHSHTHSYIHYGYDKAFRHLGFETYWLDDSDKTDHIDFAGSLFFTMGADANRNMPLRDDCYYILHN